MNQLRGEIQAVSKDLGDKMYALSMQMSTLVGKFDVLQSMKADLDQARDTSKDALAMSKSAHKRIDDLVADVKPITDSAVVEKVKGLETTVRTLAITVIGGLITGAIGLLFFYARGGS